MSRILLGSVLAVSLLLGIGSGPAARASTRVSIVPLAAVGAGAKSVSRATLAAMVKTLRRAEGIDAAAEKGKRARVLRRCAERPECLKKAKQRLGLDLILTGSVQAQRRRVVIELDLVATTDGRTLASERLEGKKGKRLVAQAALAAGKMLRSAQAPRTPARAAPQEEELASGAPVTQVADTESP